MWCSASLGSAQQSYRNVSKQILQGSTGRPLWWERKLRPRCYRERANLYTSKDAGSCVSDLFWLCRPLQIEKFQSEESPICLADMAIAITIIKMAAFYKILITWASSSNPLGKYLKRGPMLRIKINGFIFRLTGRCIIGSQPLSSVDKLVRLPDEKQYPTTPP